MLVTLHRFFKKNDVFQPIKHHDIKYFISTFAKVFFQDKILSK